MGRIARVFESCEQKAVIVRMEPSCTTVSVCALLGARCSIYTSPRLADILRITSAWPLEQIAVN